MDEKEWETHPSYGMLQISRCSGLANLFGSHVAHQHFITLKISEGMRSNDSGYDFYYSPNKPYVEVKLSAAQFAEAITSLNIGMGVPCTISYMNGEQIPRPPKESSEADRAKHCVDKHALKADAKVLEDGSKIREILAKPSIGKADREFIAKLLENITSAVRRNIPFYVDQFTEATERVTSKAKTEFESMICHHFAQLGLEAHKAGFMLEDGGKNEPQE